VAYAVAVGGTYAYVADKYAGLLIIDISEPSAPRIVGSYYLQFAVDVAIADSYAYVADFGSGLQVIDVSDPTSPGIVGMISVTDPMDGPLNVAVAGNHAYLTLGPPGLDIIDVSDRASPQRVGTVPLPGAAFGVVVANQHAYVTNTYLPGLQILDIGDPMLPFVVGTTSTPDAALAVVVSGGFAFIACPRSGLQVIDVENPASAPLVGSVTTPDTPRGVAVCGHYAYVADRISGLQVIDINDPMSPRIVSSVATPYAAYDVAIDGNHAYVATGVTLEVVDITEPLSPRVVGSVEVRATAVAVTDNYALVVSYSSGEQLYVVDISDPTAPKFVGSSGYDLFQATDVFVAGNHAYVVDTQYRVNFKVFDITDPLLPRMVSSLRTGSADGLWVVNNHAYLACGFGLQVVDVMDPMSPQIVGSVLTPDRIRCVAAADGYAYVAGGGWAHVIDISEPRSGTIVGTVYLPGPHDSGGIALTPEHACIAGSGLQVIRRQCSRPTPVFLLDFSLSRLAAGIEARWEVYGTTGSDAFRLMASTGDDTWTIAVHTENGRSFVAWDRELRQLEPFSITYTLWYRESEGNWVQLAERVLSPRYAADSGLGDPYPNPFNPSVSIPFVLERSQRVSLTVHDASGREVVRLLEGEARAGHNQVIWEGRDSHGLRVSSGVYIVRLQTASGTEARRLVMLK